jgi:catechol 2,3-dioxygenase-like lactoylglutathione lyase family enzyme
MTSLREVWAMGNFIRITPFMHVDDVPAAVRFFVDVLGFKAWIDTPVYAYVQREVAGVRIMKASQSPGEEVPPGNRRFMYYIDVEDVDALLAELKPKLDALPKGDVFGPKDHEYGQRELMVVAPDGNLVVFGQSIFEMPVEKYM